MVGAELLAAKLRKARYAVVLTGAGASTDSGLPDFRSKEGLWRGVDPMKLASMSALRQSPVEFYQFYRQRLVRLRNALPNPVHTSIAGLQHSGHIMALITQNVDGLHTAAGSPDVIEVHGNLRESVCVKCRSRFSADLLDVDVATPADVPRCPECRGQLKPGVVLFEEALPERAIARALAATEQADLFLVVGSSLEVGPVNQLPAMAVEGGAELAILNLEPTYLDRRAALVIRERAAGILSMVSNILTEK